MSKENNVTRLELLRMAVQLVTNEYIDRRAQDHNAWLAQSDALWKARREKLPYPAFPPYPNEAVIVARANVLSEFLNHEPLDPIKPAPVSAAAAVVEPEPVVAVAPTAAPTLAPTAAPTVAPTAAPIPVIELTPEPTAEPTLAPTEAPTAEPTPAPTEAPTSAPILTFAPTAAPTPEPTQVHAKYAEEITAIFQTPIAIEPPVLPVIDPDMASAKEIEKKSMFDNLANFGKNSESAMPIFANWRAAWRKSDSQ